MAVTKTKFINYTRCPRYVALDNLKKDKLDADVSLKEYREEERKESLQEILDGMYDENGVDQIDTISENMEIMMPYYNMVEILAGRLAPKYFPGKFTYAWNTSNQESFDCNINNIKYLCYVDIYNEVDDYFNIIEVKATSSKNYLELGKKTKGELTPIFYKGTDSIYHLLEEDNVEKYMEIDDYNKARSKLLNKYTNVGHYVYDIAVQRYIIENDLKQNNMEDKIDKIRYYLAVLNSDYVFPGRYDKGEPVYETDLNGEDIIRYFDVTNITRDLQDVIDMDRKKVERYIFDTNIDRYPIGLHCEHKKTYGCKYFKLCSDMLPEYNSILNFLEGHNGFKDENGNKYDRFDLIKDGIYKIVDMPDNLLHREKNRIQKEVIIKDTPYVDYEKLRDGINNIEYPIYHLDFETFPGPLPRFRGERCYTQSVFQFSLHIEREPGVCDKEKDHYGFLAYNHDDLREELIKKMIEWIDTSKGTILVYNESFEKSRLKELAGMFPKYATELLKMRSMVFDLMYVIKGNSKIYEELGYNHERASMFNYYHKNMSGSFSIKKILPLFTSLNYKDLEVSNGMEAVVAYAKFPKLDEKSFEYMYKSLEIYCCQDTWAMVEILRGLRALVDSHFKEM